MTNDIKLSLLKADLQMTTNVNDEYLEFLLRSAVKLIEREGIINDGSDEYSLIQIQYAAYMFRKRASSDTKMPRYLRWEMNNFLIHQKAQVKNDI